MQQPSSPKAFEQAKASFLQGLACHRAGDDAQAEAHYLASLQLLPGRASTLINLAATRLRLGRPLDALASADAALAAEPDSAEAWLHRATALAELGRTDDALASYDRLLALDPAHVVGWSGRGNVLRELKRPVEAAQAFREALRHGADPALHAYYLAAVEATAAPPAAPPCYVEGLFDSYADDFEVHLVDRLHYRAHRRLVDTLVAAAPGPFASALDLGCGTGLCAPLVRPLAALLTGVDLSSRMLDKARRLGLYDRLEQADVVEFVRRPAERHDLVLAADVFIYIGELDALFAGVRAAMPHGGVFAFSVERLDDARGDWRLQPSLRYAHSAAHLRRLAGRHGFDVAAMRPAPLRDDQRGAVDGLYVVLRGGSA